MNSLSTQLRKIFALGHVILDDSFLLHHSCEGGFKPFEIYCSCFHTMICLATDLKPTHPQMYSTIYEFAFNDVKSRENAPSIKQCFNMPQRIEYDL